MKSTTELYGPETARDLKLLVVMGRCQQSLFRRLSPLVRETGLTYAQFTVMEALYHKGPLTVNEIIDKTLSSSGNIAVVADNLEKAGWAVKSVDSEDRRIRRVKLTPKGKEKISSYFPEHFKEIRAAFSSLDGEEKATLIRLLKKLGRSMVTGLPAGDLTTGNEITALKRGGAR